MILYVARHGETTWNREGRYQGQRESQLTDTGREQALALAGALRERPLSAIYSSPLARCRDTARALADACAIEPTLDERLIEIGHGTWEGRLREDVERDDPERFAQWRLHPDRVAFPGGETLGAVLERWRAFVASLVGAGEIAVVTHDVLVRLAILDASGRGSQRLWEPRVVNGGFARLELHDGRLALLDECIDSHLAGILVDTSRQAL
ncbi:MAG TPA: histidine phosphatase family protein [Candidatus Baltobacteraceae bacterium]|nr:histidine phosphatase family protein [Candidatus Baltobacteraceae bacterium]